MQALYTFAHEKRSRKASYLKEKKIKVHGNAKHKKIGFKGQLVRSGRFGHTMQNYLGRMNESKKN